MSQPLDRTCKLEPLGDIDIEAGEFWSNPFEMPHNGDNLSAYERNRLFLNIDGEQFIDGSFASGVNIDSDSRSAMVGDFDGNLTPDLLVASVGGGPLRLFLNRTDTTGRLTLRLVGTDSNRTGLGAKVALETGDRKIVREVFAANGFMGHSPPVLYLGTGGQDEVSRLTVTWPSGETQEFTHVPTNRQVSLIEGRPRAWTTPPAADDSSRP